MELREFVRTVLVDVVAGVVDAEQDLGEHHAVIGHTYDSAAQQKNPIKTTLEFDVALGGETSGEGGGHATVLFGFVEVGGEGAGGKKTSEFSRVKFTVPMCLPRPRKRVQP
jgi:hypothetical protein